MVGRGYPGAFFGLRKSLLFLLLLFVLHLIYDLSHSTIAKFGHKLRPFALLGCRLLSHCDIFFDQFRRLTQSARHKFDSSLSLIYSLLIKLFSQFVFQNLCFFLFFARPNEVLFHLFLGLLLLGHLVDLLLSERLNPVFDRVRLG